LRSSVQGCGIGSGYLVRLLCFGLGFFIGSILGYRIGQYREE